MEVSFFFRGVLIGVSIAAQIGPMAILCIRRTIARGRLAGLVSGLGIASADGLYASIGGFGLTFISQFLLDQQIWFRLIGGFFLCYLGIKTMLARPAENAAVSEGRGLVGYYVSTLLLTLTNPLTILSFTAILAGLGLGSTQGNYGSAALLILGVFSGSAFWWLILTTGVTIFRTKLTPPILQWINRLAGMIIGGFGVYILWGEVETLFFAVPKF